MQALFERLTFACGGNRRLGGLRSLVCCTLQGLLCLDAGTQFLAGAVFGLGAGLGRAQRFSLQMHIGLRGQPCDAFCFGTLIGRPRNLRITTALRIELLGQCLLRGKPPCRGCSQIGFQGFAFNSCRFFGLGLLK